MKKTVFLSFVLSLIGSLPIQAFDFQVDNLCYTTNENGTTVSVNGQGSYCFGELIIPASVIYEGVSYTVTSVRNGGFANCTDITSVEISEGIQLIGEGAFVNCMQLTKATIPASVDTIGTSAFYNCSLLDSVVISEGVSCIKRNAFQSCTSLKKIKIPSTVNQIQDGTFLFCSSLESVTIPENVTSIGNSAFLFCTKLSAIEIPSGVTFIGSMTFAFCDSLSSLAIPSGIDTIQVSSFQGCAALTSVTIPENVVYIAGSAFAGCTGLTTIYAKGLIPPVTIEDAFAGIDKSVCTLYVPEDSYMDYHFSIGWNGFLSIEEEITSVQEDIETTPITLSTEGDILVIRSAYCTEIITIYSDTGKELMNFTLEEGKEKCVKLPTGVLYVVKVGNTVKKVLI